MFSQTDSVHRGAISLWSLPRSSRQRPLLPKYFQHAVERKNISVSQLYFKLTIVFQDQKNVEIRKTNCEALRKLSAGKWKGKQWASEKIPTLEEILDLLPADFSLYLEVKAGPEFLEPLAEIIDRRPILKDQLILITYSKPFLVQFKKQFPGFKAYLLVKFERQPPIIGKHHPKIEKIIESLQELGVDGLDCRAQACVDEHFVEQLDKAGYPLILWTVNDLEDAKRFMKLGAFGLTTDCPEKLKKLISVNDQK